MQIYSGLNQEMPNDYWEQRFGLTEKPCVQIIRKERAPEIKDPEVLQTPQSSISEIKEQRDRVDCGQQFA